jgi:ribonuclease HI
MNCAFDGGSSNEGSGSGFIIDGVAVGFFYNGDATNSYAELNALQNLLINLKLIKPKETNVTILGDSNYIIQGVNTWMYKWEQDNWEKSNGDDVSHWQIWQNIFSIASEEPFEFKHVRGHEGYILNEISDELSWIARYFRGSRVILLNDEGIKMLKNICDKFSEYKDFNYLRQYLHEK